MKRLLFLRHGQAGQWVDDDFSRELTKDGIESIKLKAELIKAKNFKLDLIISSPSQRTEQTAEIVQKTQAFSVDILYESFLYDGYSTSEMIDYINDLPNFMETILIIGHNPNLSTLVSNLSSSKELGMNPGAIIGIEFNIDFWNKIEARQGSIFQETP